MRTLKTLLQALSVALSPRKRATQWACCNCCKDDLWHGSYEPCPTSSHPLPCPACQNYPASHVKLVEK